MTNGSNSWGVSLADIEWLRRLLQNHGNVRNLDRRDDIVFEFDRDRQKDHLRLLCCREYTMSFTRVQQGLHEFGPLEMFYIGGSWCSYTQEAKKFCVDNRIGLYITNEMQGALWKNEYWDYYQKDKDGDPIYHFGQN
jgi:hypothetical protein